VNCIVGVCRLRNSLALGISLKVSMKRHTVISRTESADGDSDTDVFYDDATDMLKDG